MACPIFSYPSLIIRKQKSKAAPGRLQPSNLVHENRGELLPRIPLLALQFGRRRPSSPSSSNPRVCVRACARCRLLLLLLSLLPVLPVVAAAVPCSPAPTVCACLRCCWPRTAGAALLMLLACFCAALPLFCLLLATAKAMAVVCESAMCVCVSCVYGWLLPQPCVASPLLA